MQIKWTEYFEQLLIVDERREAAISTLGIEVRVEGRLIQWKREWRKYEMRLKDEKREVTRHEWSQSGDVESMKGSGGRDLHERGKCLSICWKLVWFPSIRKRVIGVSVGILEALACLVYLGKYLVVVIENTRCNRIENGKRVVWIPEGKRINFLQRRR